VHGCSRLPTEYCCKFSATWRHSIVAMKLYSDVEVDCLWYQGSVE
jgi:hypothetical protein